MRLGLVQLAVDLAEPREERVARAARLARGLGSVDLVLLPELWPGGYFAFDRYAAEAEPLQGPTVAAMSALAAELGAYVHGGSFVERAGGGRLHNTSVLLSPAGELLHTFRKYHLFGYGSREPELLTAGDDVTTRATPLGTIGMTTCYDLRFPELFRLLVDRGAELLLVPAAWPAPRIGHWRLLARARAVENQVLLAGCNTAGEQHGTRLGGHSLVVAPDGTILAEAGEGEQALAVDVDLAGVAKARAQFPWLRDRRLRVTEPGNES